MPELTPMFDISELAYQLYIQDWIDQHTTPEIRLQSIREYYAYIQECMADGDPTPDSYENYLDENGYHGSLYVCYDEFCDAEYLDAGYITHLLNNEPMLVKAYHADIAERTADDDEPPYADDCDEENSDIIHGNTGKVIECDFSRMSFMDGKLEFDFDEIATMSPTFDNGKYRDVYYPRMCRHCYEKAKPILGDRYHSIASGWCEVAGCENPAEYYVRFEIDELKNISN